MKTHRFAAMDGFRKYALGLLLGAVFATAATSFADSAAAVSPSSPGELSSEMARSRILELRREIARHDELYFKKAAPVISDFEYDTLKADLRALEARFPMEAEGAAAAPVPGVGDDRGGALATHRHLAPMLSLEKAYSDEEVAAFAARAEARLGRGDATYRVEPKYDGIAVSLTYERGRLVRATTRGNGAEGDDITANALVVRGVAERLRTAPAAPWPDRIEVRGEIFLSFADFARINEERTAAGEEVFTNPRNLAAGSIRLQDTAEVAARRLELVCYGWGAWEPAAGRPETLQELRDSLAAWGLPTVKEARLASGAAELNKAVAALRGAGEAGGFPTDGAVVKLERVADQDALGLGPTSPRWALARKFAPERAATKLLGVVWQVGRTGVLTPVAELAPVELDGSTVARATLHNADEIARRDLRVGDRVFVEKAGEIIPAVVGVDASTRAADSAPYVFPAACPACAQPVARTEGRAALRCGNARCLAQVARRIEHLASADALAVNGLGPAVIDALVARGKVGAPVDLFRLSAEDLRGLPGVGERSAENLLAELGAARSRAQADGARLIYGLGWPGVGREAARRLASTFGGWEALAAADEEALTKEGGAALSAAMARSLRPYLSSPAGQAERKAWAAAGIGVTWNRPEPSVEAGVWAGQVVVVTGTLSRWTRAEVSARLTEAGAQVGADVTRRTTLLVAGAEPGEKLVKARKLGIEIIDETELTRRLGVP